MGSSAERPAQLVRPGLRDACCTDSSVTDTHPGQCKVMGLREREQFRER